MAIDTVYPLKLETPVEGGTQLDMFPTEANPLQDYLATKGVCFEADKNFFFDKVGRTFSFNHPRTYEKATYLANGEIDYIEFFNSNTFITANRVAKISFTYDVNIDPTAEVVALYDTNGSTILRTITWSHIFSGGDLTQSDFIVA